MAKGKVSVVAEEGGEMYIVLLFSDEEDRRLFFTEEEERIEDVGRVRDTKKYIYRKDTRKWKSISA